VIITQIDTERHAGIVCSFVNVPLNCGGNLVVWCVFGVLRVFDGYKRRLDIHISTKGQVIYNILRCNRRSLTANHGTWSYTCITHMLSMI
jgi:hypothetical protein